jgi:hypothetical protein
VIAYPKPALTNVRPASSSLTDDEVDRLYACEHRFMPMEHAYGFGMCELCGVMMWMSVEMAYVDWRGLETKGEA